MRKTTNPAIKAKRTAITTPAPIPTLAAVKSPLCVGLDAGDVFFEDGAFEIMLPEVAMSVLMVVDNDVLPEDNADVIDVSFGGRSSPESSILLETTPQPEDPAVTRQRREKVCCQHRCIHSVCLRHGWAFKKCRIHQPAIELRSTGLCEVEAIT